MLQKFNDHGISVGRLSFLYGAKKNFIGKIPVEIFDEEEEGRFEFVRFYLNDISVKANGIKDFKLEQAGSDYVTFRIEEDLYFLTIKLNSDGTIGKLNIVDSNGKPLNKKYTNLIITVPFLRRQVESITCKLNARSNEVSKEKLTDGYFKFKVNYKLIINPNGTLHNLLYLGEEYKNSFITEVCDIEKDICLTDYIADLKDSPIVNIDRVTITDFYVSSIITSEGYEVKSNSKTRSVGCIKDDILFSESSSYPNVLINSGVGKGENNFKVEYIGCYNMDNEMATNRFAVTIKDMNKPVPQVIYVTCVYNVDINKA